MGMMHSIESRFPFLDERVVQFAMNLPYKHKVAIFGRFTSWKHPFQSGKHLVRLVASRYLPAPIAFGVKKGFPVQGLHLIQMDSSFLSDGFLANILGLDNTALNRFFKGLDRYHQALFGMVEIWGKLFVMGMSQAEVQQSVSKNFSYKSI
jgi:asparagine synthase (glutamine-hydrolysing)